MKEYLQQEKDERELLAEEILEQLKVSVMMKWSFLQTAIGQLRYIREEGVISLGTDGRYLYYNLRYVIQQYKLSGEALTADFLHMMIHLVLQHPFKQIGVYADYWNLAADIAVENILSEVGVNINPNPLNQEAKCLLVQIRNSVRAFTAERIYEYLIGHLPGEQLTGELVNAFFRDCHEFWYLRQNTPLNDEKGDSGTESTAFSDMLSQSNTAKKKTGEHSEIDKSSDTHTQTESDARQAGASEGAKQGESGAFQKTEHELQYGSPSNEGGQENKDRNASESTAEGGKVVSPSAEKESTKNDLTEYNYDNLDHEMQPYDSDTEEDRVIADNNPDTLVGDYGTLKKLWEKVGRQVQISMEMLRHEMCMGKSDFMMSLKDIHRDRVNYAALLKRLSIAGEVMKINDEEFDYIYYSYGLSLYHNVPLIEPLEYKEIKAVKEFVIAVDTSASCQGELVRLFITKTYSLLKQQESFFRKINVHILQCDEKLQMDHKITQEAELEEYINELVLHGFGGTDFRPVFSYVDELIRKKEFLNLKGVIYMTDGLGIFPDRKPNYETIFAFVNEIQTDVRLPAWVIPIVLSDSDL